MFVHPDFDPIIFQVGPLALRWYGLMYLVGFAGAWYFGQKRLEANPIMTKDAYSDVIFWGAMGVILGGRFGYALFYQFDRVLAEPLWLLKVWEGGMSFHGGMLGVIIATYLFSLRYKMSMLQLLDFAGPFIPIGLGAGRLANFINQELWGRATDGPWGMIFPNDPYGLARHPSQLYEVALEGIVLCAILWVYSMKPRPRGAVAGLGLALYGCFRFIIEFAREPDQHLGFVSFDWMTRGQELCLPMIIGGFLMLAWAYKNNAVDGGNESVAKSTKK